MRTVDWVSVKEVWGFAVYGFWADTFGGFRLLFSIVWVLVFGWFTVFELWVVMVVEGVVA